MCKFIKSGCLLCSSRRQLMFPVWFHAHGKRGPFSCRDFLPAPQICKSFFAPPSFFRWHRGCFRCFSGFQALFLPEAKTPPRAAGVGAQFQGGASCLLETRPDENSVAGRLRTTSRHKGRISSLKKRDKAGTISNLKHYHGFHDRSRGHRDQSSCLARQTKP